MLSLFLNPFTMIAGAIMVLAPIIIHLINRLRYRRVQWAAMEFLLKSLKKNRRKLILKQLLLLILRCLIVALFAVLLARYIGAAFGVGQPQGTLHVVIVDDTASMTDYWRQEGVNKTTFDVARRSIVEDIAAGAADAGSPQSIEIVTLTNPRDSHRIERVNPQSVAELQTWLESVKATALHADFAPAIEAAKRLFEQQPEAKRVLHIVSDFRAKDWSSSTSESLAQLLPSAINGKAGTLHLIDVAHPVRSSNRSAAMDHGNVGIFDLQPETKLASRFMPVEFTLTLANFTPTSRKNVRVVVRVNGLVREDASLSVADLPTGLTTATFIATFDQPGINMITASIEPDEAGLAVDDLRYATIEIRDKVPLLFVTTADSASRSKLDADGFYLRALFLEAAKGFDVVERGPQELEQPNLNHYATIFVLNVSRLSDKAKANLEAYVHSGGGVMFAMGDQTDVNFFTQWHADGKGLFPVPVAKATEALSDAQRMERMLLDASMPPKILPRNETHSLLSHIYSDRNREANLYLKFAFIERYMPVPRARWSPEPGRSDELLTLPNFHSVDDFKEPVQRLLSRLPSEDSKFAAYRDKLREHQRQIREVLAANRPLSVLADSIEALLIDHNDPSKPESVNLQEFWSRPEQSALKSEFTQLMDVVRFGDPLLVTQTFGRGRVLALLTTAGSAWNDWPNGPSRPYWVMVMLEAQKYLSGTASDANRKVGSTVEVPLDPTRFDGRLRRSFVREVLPDSSQRTGPVDQGEQSAVASGNKLVYTFNDAKVPGVYRLDLGLKDKNGSHSSESIAFAFNVDTAAEGDLRRATRDDLAAAAPAMQLHSPGSGLARILKDRKSDLSESPWIYLLLLGLLIVEQALAVHLSFHAPKEPIAIRSGS